MDEDTYVEYSVYSVVLQWFQTSCCATINSHNCEFLSLCHH